MAKLYTSCETRWASRSLFYQGASKPSAWTFGARAAVLGHGGGHEAESLGTLCFINFIIWISRYPYQISRAPVSNRFRPFPFFWTMNWTNSIYGRLIQCKPVQTMTLLFFSPCDPCARTLHQILHLDLDIQYFLKITKSQELVKFDMEITYIYIYIIGYYRMS